MKNIASLLLILCRLLPSRWVTCINSCVQAAKSSIGDTVVSSSVGTFPPTIGGQSLLVDLIGHGLTRGKSYVDEPLLQANASRTIAPKRYTSGYMMAESFYAASRFVCQEDVFIGDPLCSPC